MGEDRVALDHTAWQMIERKRAEAGVPTLEAAGRPPRYIATAADQAHKLGTNDPPSLAKVTVSVGVEVVVVVAGVAGAMMIGGAWYS